MKEIDSIKLKKIQLDILNYIDDFCKKNNINYWLDSGTLLGAVRHKGYIPWDDDIDIGMLREDYDKFMNLFNKNNDSNYKAYCFDNNNNWNYSYGKVLDENTILYEPDENIGIKSSVYVDVFVFDFAPEDDNILNKMYKKRNLYYRCNTYQIFKFFKLNTNFFKKIVLFFIWLLLQLFPKGYFIKKSLDNCKKYSNVDTGYIGNFSGMVGRVKCPKSIFNSFIKLKFEGKKYPVPIGYKEWLTAFYGDYMKLPPKEKQISHHKFVAYYK